MWTFFKIVNFFWLMAATDFWPTALYNQGPMLLVIDALLLISLSYLPIKCKLDLKTFFIAISGLGMILWSFFINGYVMGVVTALQLLLPMILIQLPYDYLKDLLNFTVKCFAILLIPALLIYWALFFIPLPSIGKFVHPNYVPYDNYIFYISTTWDNGILTRFNAFLLEPGHLALLCTFLTFACRYRYKENKWLFVLLVCIIFSFSLAGYLLYTIGFILLKINSFPKAVAVMGLGVAVVLGVMEFSGGDNAMNKLILERLERDEHSGIKGNNRFTDSTDFIYQKSVNKGDAWVGVKDKTSMDAVEGAGFKIYIIKNGFIGVILSLLFYLCLFPSNPDYKYTISFLIVFMLCFIQRSAPEGYHWLFPYVTGIYLAKYEKERRELQVTVDQLT